MVGFQGKAFEIHRAWVLGCGLGNGDNKDNKFTGPLRGFYEMVYVKGLVTEPCTGYAVDKWCAMTSVIIILFLMVVLVCSLLKLYIKPTC